MKEESKHMEVELHSLKFMSRIFKSSESLQECDFYFRRLGISLPEALETHVHRFNACRLVEMQLDVIGFPPH